MSKFADKIAQLEVETDTPERMIIKGLNGQPLRDEDGSENYILLYSADSERARAHQRSVTTRRLATRGRGTVTAAELEADAIELLVALTAGWGSISADGETETPEADFTPAAARKLYMDPKNSELRDQVSMFVDSRTNFLKALPKT